MLSEFINTLLTSMLVVFVFMTVVFVIAQYKKRNDIADIAWGLGFVLIAITLFLKAPEVTSKSWLIVMMVAVWGVRLAVHIQVRHKGKPEDGRYQAMRQKWKHPVVQSYLNVFLAQGFFMLLVALPILLFFSSSPGTLKWYNFIGFAVWLTGFLFEAIGDYQLAQFLRKKTKQQVVMDYGLWRYTRHPNYFGEVSLWWGVYLFVLPVPLWVLGLLGPLTITYLIIGVSGIPMLEARYKGNKAYERYQKTTSAFLPLPPRQ